MKTVRTRLVASLLSVVLGGLPLAAQGQQGAGEEREERREYKQEFWGGACRAERKREANGRDRAGRGCKGPRLGAARDFPASVPTHAPGARPRGPEPGIGISER
jgi:hypothetical protein